MSRFIEPAVLLALRDGSSHGYDLADAVGELIGTERVDYGNLYRLLRFLEADELVTSEWNDQLPGRSKRMYELTPQGANLLAAWITALESTQERIGAFLQTYHKGTS
jgi:PadR family transcriptional regulator PadR